MRGYTALINEMQEAGIPAEQILAVIKGIESKKEISRQKSREATRERVRKHREMKRDVTPVTQCNALHDVTPLEGSFLSPTPPIHSPKTPKENPPKGGQKKRDGFVLPDWIHAEPWEAYLEMRRRIGKPATGRAMALAVEKLAVLRRGGHDPTAVLEQSTFNSWQGLFEIKGEMSNGFQNKPAKTKLQRAAESIAAANPGRGFGGDFRA